MGNLFSRFRFRFRSRTRGSQSQYSPFKLTDLSDVALLKVLTHMPAIQLYTMTLLSPRCNIVAKRFNLNTSYLRANRRSFLIDYGDGLCDYFCRKSIDDLWIDYLFKFSQFVGKSFDEIFIEAIDFERIWNCICEEQSGVNCLSLYVNKSTGLQKTIKMLLANSRLTKLNLLCFALSDPVAFEFTDPFIFERPPRQLQIKNASWISVQNVLDIESEYFKLEHTNLTDHDLNYLLKQWMDENLRDDVTRKLRMMEIVRSDMTEIDSSVVLDGFEDQIAYHGVEGDQKIFNFEWNATYRIGVYIENNMFWFHPYFQHEFED